MSAGRRKLIISLDFNMITSTNGNHHFYSWNIDNLPADTIVGICPAIEAAGARLHLFFNSFEFSALENCCLSLRNISVTSCSYLPLSLYSYSEALEQ
jgi:hypothetical protein